jgi:glycolate oxidase iron-sulfur subunit
MIGTNSNASSGLSGMLDSSASPSLDLIKDCVHCGFCLPSCPTYGLWGEESHSPRGRIYLMKLGAQGAVGMTDTYVSHFDKCLGCMACVTDCPSGVQYGTLIETTRAQIEQAYQRPVADRLFRKLLSKILPYPNRLRILALHLWLYQRVGLQWLVRRTGFLSAHSPRLAALDELLPPLSISAVVETVPEKTDAQSPKRHRVGLLLGCVQRVFAQNINRATVRVLAAEGYEVIAPEQGCCGALMLHAGRREEAIAQAKSMIDTFAEADIDTIVINAAGCGSAMKEYHRLLKDEPEYVDRAQSFAAKCKDLSEVLSALESRSNRCSKDLRVAYLDACHLQHAQGIKIQPRSLLAAIPGIDLVEIPESSACCGSAGIYNLTEPETARQIGDRKAQNIRVARADVVVTSNIGCLLQMKSALARTKQNLPVVHIAELLEATMENHQPTSKDQAVSGTPSLS